jgi:uncharacterized protein
MINADLLTPDFWMLMLIVERVRSPLAWMQLLVGLFGYGLAVTLMIESGLGLGPWDAFHVGINILTGISVGIASILVGIVLQVGTWFIGVRPGVGTLANIIMIGVVIDLLTPIVPEAQGWLWGLAYYLPGVLICGLSTGLYISAGMGKGPRDGLMIAVSDLSGWPIRRSRTAIEIVVLLCGWLMGAAIGIGTLIFAFGIGPAAQWGLRVCGVTKQSAISRQPPGMGHQLSVAPCKADSVAD